MEHRSAPRMRAVLKAEIRYNNGLMSAPCIVRDISETGARLELAGDLALPDRIDLFIEKRNQTFHAIVKRRHGREIGIAFVDTQAKPAADAGLAERVAKLEAELAELRQVVGALAASLSKPA